MNNEIPNAKIVSPLTNEEKTALTKQVEATIKNYKIGFAVACISIVIFVGIFIAPAMYLALRKQQKLLIDIQQADLEVYEVKGTLRRRNVGNVGSLYAYKIDGVMIPSQVLSDNDKSGIKNQLGKTVAFQYIPAISKNRLYKDAEGRGYNFITKLPLD